MARATHAFEAADLPDRPWLHRLAILAGVATFVLIGIGGNVTSIGAGMAFPEGWTTRGYWSLIAPPSTWWDSPHQFWEHVHRVMGWIVGMLFITLVVALWRREWWLPRRHGERTRKWLAVAGTAALLLVSVQGVLGAYRVNLNSEALAFVHGINGQLVLGLTVVIAATTSRAWLRLAREPARRDRRLGRGMRLAGWGLLGLLVLQLVLGAAVRHTHATLAIPDFPTSYGGILPPMSEEALRQATGEAGATDAAGGNGAGVEANPEFGYSIRDVHLHFTHRVMAGVIGVWGFALVIALGAKAPARRELLFPRLWLIALIFAQIALGAMVIWEDGDSATATAHQVMGAALIAVATWLALRIHLVSMRSTTRESQSAAATADKDEPSRPRSPQSSPA